jgi:hypothetical protein
MNYYNYEEIFGGNLHAIQENKKKTKIKYKNWPKNTINKPH